VSLDKPRLADVGALVRGAKLREGTVSVCLAGDLVGEWEALAEQLNDAPAADSLSGTGGGPIREQMNELRGQMLEATVEFKFTALPRRQFRELKAAHPPRRDADGKLTDPRDGLGINYDSFMDALVRAAIVEPKLDEETLTMLLDERLTDRQYEELTDVAWNLNRATVSVPFLPAASANPTSTSTT
jgi:hypothetical protein